MPVAIDEIVADVEPPAPADRREESDGAKKPSPEAEARRLRSFLARLERRKRRVRAD